VGKLHRYYTLRLENSLHPSHKINNVGHMRKHIITQ
jgi:hypothetical protein